MSRNTILHSSLLALALVAWAPGSPALSQQPGVAPAGMEAAKWFVLRNRTSGDCWTARLISIKGGYRSRSDLKAGGPYETEREALEQIEVLQRQGTCT